MNISPEAFLTPARLSSSVELLLTLAVISLAPFFFISATSFLRIIVVFSLSRVAIGTQQTPPNSVLIGLALFMTLFIMAPTWQQVNDRALTPYNQGKLSVRQALTQGMSPMRQFMIKQTRERDLALFIDFQRGPRPRSFAEVPTHVLVPAYMISELRTAFQIGFLVFIPFVVIDLVVANVLLSLGMFMLSPVLVSLPFKILLFVLTDGWNLLTRGLMLSFQ